MSNAIFPSVNKDASVSQPPEWALLERGFRACVQAADPAVCLPPHLHHVPAGHKIVVVGAGKAAAAMAQTFERHHAGDVSGVVVTRYDHSALTRKIKVLEASHPVPDEAGVMATREILATLAAADPDAVIVGLFSGGGSALLCAPVEGVSLRDKQAVNRALLHSGLPIDAMNRIRRWLSLVKGGKLAGFAKNRRFISFMMSDVPGDDLSVIASGPTVGVQGSDQSLGALAVLAGLDSMPQVMRALNDPSNAPVQSSSPTMRHVSNILITSPGLALAAAQYAFEQAGYEVRFLGDDLEDDATALGAQHAALALEALREDRPICILSGGETTVNVTNPSGEGGRNTEYLLSLAINLNGQPRIYAMAADTDGIDGKGQHAGAFIAPQTLVRAHSLGLDPKNLLSQNRSLAVFKATESVFQTGPTLTNVNDYRAILVNPKA